MMKAQSTIRKQIRRLQSIADNPEVPEPIRTAAYESYHALRWVIEDTEWSPARLHEQAAEAAKEKT